MREDNPIFVNEIYKYCDKNIGEKALFSVFTNLWPEEKFIIKKDLMGLTEKIINNLLKKGILIEIEKSERLESPYGYYEIKPHDDLVKNNGYMKKKMKMLS
ncbi:MAG: hypothetical protein AABY32_06085 [Nanoarchaeota archaeon]